MCIQTQKRLKISDRPHLSAAPPNCKQRLPLIFYHHVLDHFSFSSLPQQVKTQVSLRYLNWLDYTSLSSPSHLNSQLLLIIQDSILREALYDHPICVYPVGPLSSYSISPVAYIFFISLLTTYLKFLLIYVFTVSLYRISSKQGPHLSEATFYLPEKCLAQEEKKFFLLNEQL